MGETHADSASHTDQRDLFCRLLLLHFDVARRCWVLSGGGMSGYGVMLGLCGFLPLVLSSLAFRFVLEILLVFFLRCFVAHSRAV